MRAARAMFPPVPSERAAARALRLFREDQDSRKSLQRRDGSYADSRAGLPAGGPFPGKRPHFMACRPAY